MEAYTSRTLKEDDALAEELRKSIDASTLSVKADILAVLDVLIPVVEPAAKAVRASEEQVNALSQAELVGRKQVIDTLWSERKNVENALGRSGRGLARFIFFDFRKDRSQESPDEPQAAPPGPDDPKEPPPK